MIPELSAAHITQTALQILKAQGITAWRQTNNSGRRRMNQVNKGVSDILGYQRGTAVFVACEVKKIGDKLSDDQRKFLQGVHDGGGLAFVAHQIGFHVKVDLYVEYINKK